MSLTLFSPSEGAEFSRKQREGEKQKLVKIQEQVVLKYRELAKAENDFESALTRQRAQWEKEENDFNTRIAPLRVEVLALEERRKQALIPLTERGKELDSRERDLDERQSKIDLRETAVDDMFELQTKRLDEVSEREQNITELSQSLKVRVLNVEQREAEAVKQSEQVTTAVAKAMSDIISRETALSRQEAGQVSRETAFNEEKKRILAINDSFVDRERKIQDERELLTRAAKEIEQKQHGTQ